MQLPKRLTDSELAEISAAVRDRAKNPAEKTFIRYRVNGPTDTAYWANASFDPNYQCSVIGLSADEYQKLLAVDLRGYSDKLGHWLRDGALGHVMALYKRNGKYFIDSYFGDGSKGTEANTGKPLADDELRLEQPNVFGGFYVLKKDGTLQGWSENGMSLSR